MRLGDCVVRQPNRRSLPQVSDLFAREQQYPFAQAQHNDRSHKQEKAPCNDGVQVIVNSRSMVCTNRFFRRLDLSTNTRGFGAGEGGF